MLLLPHFGHLVHVLLVFIEVTYLKDKLFQKIIISIRNC